MTSSSPGLWKVVVTGEGGRWRAGSRFPGGWGKGGPGAAAGGGSGAQRRGRPTLGPRFPSAAAPSTAHACVGGVGGGGGPGAGAAGRRPAAVDASPDAIGGALGLAGGRGAPGATARRDRVTTAPVPALAPCPCASTRP